MTMDTKVQLWTSNVAVGNVTSVEDAYDGSYVPSLTESQRKQIIAAFNAEAYDMASEYAWKKTMVKLKEAIASLGYEFVSQTLNRTNIDEYTQLTNVISDNEAIMIAENVGFISEEGAMNLRHSLELLSYYFSSKADEENRTLDKVHAMAIIIDCAKHVLSIKSNPKDLSFTKFSGKLLNEQIEENGGFYKEIIGSSLFYLKTVCNLLLMAIKDRKTAQMECALSNLNILIEPIWEKLPEEDRYKIGKTYRDVVTDGNEKAANSMRKALMKVKGFNYVPETLRSDTFMELAQKLIDVHYGFDNFYFETSAVKALASLGTIIPAPASDICIRAYLLVVMGNSYGTSHSAEPLARGELLKIGEQQWFSYLKRTLPYDEDILLNLSGKNRIENFKSILSAKNLLNFTDTSRDVQLLLGALERCDYTKVKDIASGMLKKLR